MLSKPIDLKEHHHHKAKDIISVVSFDCAFKVFAQSQNKLLYEL